ncbi:hypothetical protein D7S86_20035 [Pararobbsia silviterrae]|uniref:Uncharacterized protein n=1 Tax=Pararobbsia silviterrae TaxID=1792498 RepID=A0A494XG08_9BURK|nr:hypothetical protein D7S86_20035 [Pararobbsia silviterrae]
MADEWQYQVRFTASDALASALRESDVHVAYAALDAVLRAHRASIRCQYDAFADYVDEAERLGTDRYPLYAWTRATIDNPEKKRKYLAAFTVYVDGDEVYDAPVAQSLHAALRALSDEARIANVVLLDTNPANNPQPPARAA